jgi:HEAT repeat protein
MPLLLSRTTFWFLFLAALVLGGTAGGTADTSDRRADDHYKKALAAGCSGRFAEARRALLDARAADPQHIPSRRAQDLLADQKVGFVGDEAAALLFKGLDLQAREDWRGAARAYREALALDPTYYLALHNLATTLYQTGDNDSAIAGFLKALEWKDTYPYTHNNLGLAYARAGRHEEACEHLRRAIDLASDYHKAYNNLAASLRALGKEDEADEMLRQALTIKPDYALAAANLAPRPERNAPDEGASTDALLDALEHGSWDERSGARDDLLARADPRSASRLLALTRNDRPEVRAGAARVLGRVKSPDALGALAALLAGDREWTVRFEAAWALSQLDDASAVRPLSQALMNDHDDHVRRNAALALGAYAGCASARALQHGLADPVSEVRRHALDSLRALSGQSFGAEPAPWNEWVGAACARETSGK